MPRLPTRFALAASLSTVFALAACGGDDVTAVARSDAQTPSGGTPTTPAPTPAATVTPQPGKWKAARVGDLIDVTLGDLHPTQGAIGYDQIYYKLGRYELQPDKKFDDFCADEGLGGVASSGYTAIPTLRGSRELHVYDDRRERPRPRGAEPGRDRPERRCAVPDRRPPRPVDLLRDARRRPGAARARRRRATTSATTRATRSGSRCRAAAICASRTEKASRSRPRNCRPGLGLTLDDERPLPLARLFHARHRLQQARTSHRLSRVLLGRLAARATGHVRARRL